MRAQPTQSFCDAHPPRLVAGNTVSRASLGLLLVLFSLFPPCLGRLSGDLLIDTAAHDLGGSSANPVWQQAGSDQCSGSVGVAAAGDESEGGGSLAGVELNSAPLPPSAQPWWGRVAGEANSAYSGARRDELSLNEASCSPVTIYTRLELAFMPDGRSEHECQTTILRTAISIQRQTSISSDGDDATATCRPAR